MGLQPSLRTQFTVGYLSFILIDYWTIALSGTLLLTIACSAATMEVLVTCKETAHSCCFGIHRTYDGQSLITYLRKSSRNERWLYDSDYIDMQQSLPLHDSRSVQLVGINDVGQECGSCWEEREELFALPCGHFICSR